MGNLPDINWNLLEEEAVEHLRALVRIDTTNPPGNEIAACRYIKGVFDKEGIESRILESAPGRGNIVARLKGNGSKAPLLLDGHLDVVTADPSHWEHPPFSADVADGYVWGRGTLDMKNMVAMELTIFIEAARRGRKSSRDLIFAAVADEEAGCNLGSRFLQEKHPELIEAEYALGEFGGFTLTQRGRRFWPIGVAEKGIVWMTITAEGTPGHGSMPNPDNAAIKIARAAAAIGRAKLPMHVTDVVKTFVETLASAQPKPVGKILKQVTNPLISNIILDKLLPDKNVARSLYASLHNTANVTMLFAGEKINVVPGVASMRVDGRIIPGQTADDLVAEIRRVVGEGYKIVVDQTMPGLITDLNDPVYAAITKLIGRHDPEGVPVPYLVPGFTDAKYFSKTRAKCFGFSPVLLKPEDNFAQLIHGHNERIPVEGFKKGLRILAELVFDLMDSGK